ncbi:hypothetical protein [Marinomonas epiphytica]
MSESVVQIENEAYEPDEATLMSALRNQDDIPILMDVVTDQLTDAVSQAEHLQQSIHESLQPNSNDIASKSVEPVQSHKISAETSETQVKEESETSSMVAQELAHEEISHVIQQVLEKRLPDLVQEVVQNLAELKAK